MRQIHRVGVVSLALFVGCLLGRAQQATGTGPSTVVPAWVNFSGVLTGVNAKPLTATEGITFYLYKDAQGGTPLWMETQNVQLDKTGHYKVMLGSSSSEGIPADIFISGEARWLGVQPQGQEEQARVMLLAVPYALKAADAETVGGKPASAFMPSIAAGNSHTAGSTAPMLSGGGKKGFVPLWLSSTKLGDSELFQNPAGNLGIGTSLPAATLDVNGTADVHNTLTLFPNASRPALSISGTGFGVNHAGMVSFVSAQTFPGTGTITGVTTGSGSGLSGGGTSGTLHLSLLKTCTTNQVLEWNGSAWACATTGTGTITGVTAGTDLTGGGGSGNVTLNLDTTKVPQLNAANSFTGNQTINGNLSQTGNLTAGGSITAATGSFTANNSSTAVAVTQNGTGGGLASFATSGIALIGWSTATSGNNYGVQGLASGTGGTGLLGQAPNVGVEGTALNSSGVAGVFNNAGGGKILSGQNNGTEKFSVDGSGNITTAGSINSALTVQYVTDPCSGATSANLIGGFLAYNGVRGGVTGATIGGGGGVGFTTQGNLVTDDFGTVGGGEANTAGNSSGTTCDAVFATVAGGFGNTASGANSTVAGGEGNNATGFASTVPGGYGNTASGDFSFAGGQNAVATDNGSFLWCADDSTPCGSAGTNSFEVAVYGPILFYDGPNGSGCNLSAGGGSWNCSSDRNLKDNIVPIDSRSVLERVADLPITQWKMKAEPAGRKHIGPMAQDFYAAFGLGDSDRYIALGDGQGVALAAIQALYHVVQEKDAQIRRLNQQLQKLQLAQSREIAALTERLARIEAQDSSTGTRSMAKSTRSKQPSFRAGGGA
jgi:hypothetical protein